MLLQRLKLLVAPPVWRLLAGSWRCNETPLGPQPDHGPVIFACLHRDILPAIRYCRPAQPTLLVSKSPDGAILTRTLARNGFGFVRGSTGHDGREGFVGLLRTLRGGRHVGVAVDGPRGPFGHVHEGALQLARRSGASILPLTVHASRSVHLNTWDRTLVPVPGTSFQVIPGLPVAIEADANDDQLATARRILAERLGVTGGGCHGDS